MKKMTKEDISLIVASMQNLRPVKTAAPLAKPKLEGISFRYKTVQFHLVDDTFEEIERHQETFGDSKIYGERFALPGYGIKNEYLDGEEFQYEIIIGIESKVTLDVYHRELQTILDTIEEKHDVHIYAEPYEDMEGEKGYNIHRVIFYTNEEGIFPAE